MEQPVTDLLDALREAVGALSVLYTQTEDARESVARAQAALIEALVEACSPVLPAICERHADLHREGLPSVLRGVPVVLVREHKGVSWYVGAIEGVAVAARAHRSEQQVSCVEFATLARSVSFQRAARVLSDRIGGALTPGVNGWRTLDKQREDAKALLAKIQAASGCLR